MAIDPATGQMETPFIFDMLESIPGITTTSMFNAGRYYRTLLNGGRFDVAAGTTGRRLARAQRMGSFVGDRPVARSSSMFFGGNSRVGFLRRAAEKKAATAGTTPFLRQSIATNLNPRSFNRFGSLSSLTGTKSLGYYTPFQGMSGFADLAMKNKRIRGAAEARGITAREGAVYAGGVLGRMMTIQSLANIESTIARAGGMAAVEGGAGGAKAARALAQRTSLVQNIDKVQKMANPRLAIDMARISPRATLGVTTSAERLAAARAATSVADDPIKAVASTMTSGQASNRLTGYMAGVVKPVLMTPGQQSVLHKISTRLGTKSGIGTRAFNAQYMADFGIGGKFNGTILRNLRGSAKMFGMAGEYVAGGGSKMVAAKFAGMAATKGLGAVAMPLNVLATGQLIYDISKGVGKIAAAGVNFAKDAVKSMQGSINKPMFGAGFKDNEVAATSRSRGVMAIQNSRLNARSLLGSEAAMMAAHFG